MDARPVDPRFIESEPPAIYHVYFWSDRRRRSTEYELTAALDIHEVLRWAARSQPPVTVQPARS